MYFGVSSFVGQRLSGLDGRSFPLVRLSKCEGESLVALAIRVLDAIGNALSGKRTTNRESYPRSAPSWGRLYYFTDSHEQ